MIRSILLVSALALMSYGCSTPVAECTGTACDGGGTGGGTSGAGGGSGGGAAAGGGVGGAGGGDAGGAGGAGGGGDTDGGTGGGTAGGAGGGSAGGAGGGAAGGAGGGTAGGVGGGSAGGAGGGAAGGAGGGAAGGAGGGTMADAGITPSNVCLDVARRKCEFYIRCRTDTADSQGRNNDQVAAGERAKCEALYANDRGCNIGAAGWANSRATLDPVKYSACIDALYPATTCQRDTNDALTKCGNTPYVTAATAVGGLCTSDSECMKGWCSNSVTNTICGTCQPYLNADGGMANCFKDSQCDPAKSFCIGPDGQMNNQPCQAFTPVDGGCNFPSQNQEQCGPGVVCAATQTSMFNPQARCLPGKLENATCIKGRLECARTGRGQFELVCATDSQGFDTCVKRFNTTAGGRCATAENLPGTNTPSGTACLPNEFCASGICASRRAAGIACTLTDQCQAGLRCANMLCTPYSDVDGGCTASDQCKNELNCNAGTGTCQPGLSLVGGACSGGAGGGTLCAEGFCGQAAVTVCTALLADGQPCNNFAQCQSYACVGNVCVKACWKP